MECISASLPRTNAIFIGFITVFPAYILFCIIGHVIRKPGKEYKMYFYLFQELDMFIINLKEKVP